VPAPEDCCEPAELVGRAALARWTRLAAPDRLGTALAAARPAFAARNAAIDARASIEERRSRYLLCPHGDAAKESFADAWVGRLGRDLDALPARLAAMRWSPSRLETLGTCGFKFFARYVLGLTAADEPEAQVGRAERGTLAHAALEALFRAHPRLPAEREAARALGRDFLARWRAAVTGGIAPKDPALLDIAWQQVAAVVDSVIIGEHEVAAERSAAGRVVERLLEQPLEVALAGGVPLTLAGTPDRVDVERQGDAAVAVRVLDYKMSRDPRRYLPLIDPERQLGRTGFQIPVYLLGALGAVRDVLPDAALTGARARRSLAREAALPRAARRGGGPHPRAGGARACRSLRRRSRPVRPVLRLPGRVSLPEALARGGEGRWLTAGAPRPSRTPRSRWTARPRCGQRRARARPPCWQAASSISCGRGTTRRP
jgi:hypothetical protein